MLTDWDDLRFVLAVARAGGFAGAARALGVTHTTVSRRVAGLEARLGARLFDRTAAGQTPTEEGREAAALAERIERETTALTARVGGRDAALAGTVTLTAPLMVLTGPFAEVMTAFRAAHPGIDLRLAASNTLLDLHRREADVAIRATDTPDEGLFGVRLTEQRAAIYLAPALLARIDPTDPAAPLPWIGHLDPLAPPDEIRQTRPGAHLVARMNDKMAAAAAAAAGLGAVRLPCFMGDTAPGLVRLPGAPLFRYPDKWLLTHPDLKGAARVRAVMTWARDAVRARRPLFMGERPRV